MIFAHRGSSLKCPENTILAYEKAFKEGADGVEVDVRVTRDHVLVVFHDSNAERVTGYSRDIQTMSLEEVRALKVYGRETVPTFREVLSLAKRAGKLVLVDVKVGGLESAVAEMVLCAGMAGTVIVDSYYIDSVAKAKSMYEDLRTAVMLDPYNMRSRGNPIDIALRAGAEYVHMCDSRDVTEELVSAAHDVGLKVISGTTDDPSEITRLVNIGVDAMTSNDPENALRIMRRLGF